MIITYLKKNFIYQILTLLFKEECVTYEKNPFIQPRYTYVGLFKLFLYSTLT